MDEKRNWIQVLTLALCAVLLGVTVWQGRNISSLRDLEAETQRLAEALDGTEARLTAAEAALEELRSPRPERSVRLENPSVNTRDRLLTVDIVAELPDAEEYSPGIGFCQVGEPYRLAWKYDFLSPRSDETYAQTVTFPIEPERGLELRLEDDTVLFSSDTVLSLLPLQAGGGGISWHYNVNEELFSMCDWTVFLTDPAGEKAQGTDGEFRVYRNGEMVFTGGEIPGTYYDVIVDGEVLMNANLPCAPGDHMRLTYACTDDFGLRYEFPLDELVAMRWDDMERYPLSGRPAVSWPD